MDDMHVLSDISFEARYLTCQESIGLMNFMQIHTRPLQLGMQLLGFVVTRRVNVG